MTIKELEERFMKSHIKDRTREQLASELFSVYLVIRDNAELADNGDDPWADDLNLANVLRKHVLATR